MKPKVLMVNLGPLDDEDQEERAKALADTGALIIIPSSLSSPLCILYSLHSSFPITRRIPFLPRRVLP